MKISDWMKLTARQQHVLLLAMYVRNGIEHFHVKHLSDKQMQELNPIIRQSLYNIVSIIEDDFDTLKGKFLLGWLIDEIPEYWEIPSQNTALEDDADERAAAS